MEIHGEAKRGQLTSLYNTWRGMKDRCMNPSHKSYKYYGEKGVKICLEWQKSFENFRDWALSNGYQEGLSIDRIDVKGNYEPSNCRWATLEQQANNKTTNHFLTYNGKTQTINQWADYLGIKREIIKDRLRWGWKVDDIFETPVAQCITDKYEFEGESHSLTEWSRIKNIPYSALWKRIRDSKWTIEKALTTPVGKRKKHDKMN